MVNIWAILSQLVMEFVSTKYCYEIYVTSVKSKLCTQSHMGKEWSYVLKCSLVSVTKTRLPMQLIAFLKGKKRHLLLKSIFL